jgi:transposase
MSTMFGMFPFLMKLYADGGYQGPKFRAAVKKIIARLNVEIVKRSDKAAGFVVLPRRWVVERTFAWLGRCRRLAKDWECLNRKGRAFLRLASIRLMLGFVTLPHLRCKKGWSQSFSRSRDCLAPCVHRHRAKRTVRGG